MPKFPTSICLILRTKKAETPLEGEKNPNWLLVRIPEVTLITVFGVCMWGEWYGGVFLEVLGPRLGYWLGNKLFPWKHVLMALESNKGLQEATACGGHAQLRATGVRGLRNTRKAGRARLLCQHWHWSVYRLLSHRLPARRREQWYLSEVASTKQAPSFTLGFTSH